MRVLLDHCIPKAFARCLPGHDVQPARSRGWEALADGVLLDQMSGEIDVLITFDRSLRWQQNVAGRSFCMVLLVARQSTSRHLEPLTAHVLAALEAWRPGQVVVIGDKTTRWAPTPTP